MKTLLKTIALCSLVFLLVSLPNGVLLCQSQQQDEQFTKIDKINLHTDGSATWYTEKRFFLANTSMEVRFMQIWSAGYETEKQNFTTQTMWLVEYTKNLVGRNMEAKNFDLAYYITPSSPTGYYGIVKYQYDWLGFSKIEDKHILIGDALWWRRYVRSDDAFIVEYPEGYRVIEASPPPDYDKESESVLKWYGARTLEVGKPSVIFEERTFTIIDALMWNLPLIVGGIAIVSISLAGLWLYRFRRKELIKTIASGMLSSLEIRSEEDKVIALLKAAHGRSFQSSITKQCGFSKAKTSMLLTSMENKGIVERKKQGREKIVTLLEKS